MLTYALTAVSGMSLGTDTPCPTPVAPPIPIQHIVAGPLDIAIAMQAVGPVTADRDVPRAVKEALGLAALSPPLEALGSTCREASLVGPGAIGAGDRVTTGAVTNTGSFEVLIITATGSLIRLGPDETLWVGRAMDLAPTHQCLCECTCRGVSVQGDISFVCHADGGCPLDSSSTQCLIDQGGKLHWGQVEDCRVVYAPDESDLPGA